ncbi:MAG: UDP-N-acetylglucosamine 1-carboxyvinyltransferase [Planctomycetota bacterium]
MSETVAQDAFRVRGGRPITGRFRPSGNKNEALPAVAAALLGRGTVTLRNVPDILDVEVMLDAAASLGAEIGRNGDRERVTINAERLHQDAPDPALAAAIRGSFLFSAPLLARLGRCRLPRPGGDKIGRRRVDTHLLALRALGAKIQVGDAEYAMTLDGPFQGTDVFLDEASVMATENAVMAAAVAEGTTRIANAASEPHVQGVCRLLNAMGAEIRGIGTNLLEVEGRPELLGAEHEIGPDHIEIGSLIGLAAVTGGELVVEPVRADDLRMIGMVFRRLGIHTEIEGQRLLVPGGQELVIASDVHDAIAKVDDAPWPGFPADLLSIALVVATQARGTILMHEKLFESRMFFVDRLVGMGAKIVLCDPHRAVVVGPSALHGATISSPDIRAGMAILIAALCADGTSIIHNIRQIDRGYARIDERLRALGADIERLPA